MSKVFLWKQLSHLCPLRVPPPHLDCFYRKDTALVATASPPSLSLSYLPFLAFYDPKNNQYTFVYSDIRDYPSWLPNRLVSLHDDGLLVVAAAATQEGIPQIVTNIRRRLVVSCWMLDLIWTSALSMYLILLIMVVKRLVSVTITISIARIPWYLLLISDADQL